jgi:hypothetical protein
MQTPTWRRALALAALVPALAGLTACGEDGRSATSVTPVAPGKGACGPLPSADPSAELPGDLPALADQVLYRTSTQGKTVIVFGVVPQGDFVAVRDDLVTSLTAAGWTIDGTDQESVEAEAQFSKDTPTTTGTVKVEPLCTGHVTVRYKVNH